MNKFFLFIFSFIYLFTLLLSPEKTFAYSYQTGCPNLEPLPITVDPTSGNANTQFKVTLLWSTLTNEQFFEYNKPGTTIDVYIVPTTGPEGKRVPGRTNFSPSGRQQKDESFTIDGLFLPEGIHNVSIHLYLGQGDQCKNYEEGDHMIIVENLPTPTLAPGQTITPGGGGLKPNDFCNPDLQSAPQFACPKEFPCVKVGDKYKCNANITPTGPPPPCLEGEDENRNKITKEQIKADPKKLGQIVKCTKIDSAIGGIETDPGGFIKRLFIVLLSLSGGFAVYTITVAGYKLMISGSNPESAQESREKITSAIVGILFMILSVAILQIIGVDIFQIPGFSR